MSELDKWAVIGGSGNIGSEVQTQLKKPEVSARLGLESRPEFVVNSSGIWQADGETTAYSGLRDVEEWPAATFIALPSTDDGQIATEFIHHVLQQGKVAVTAEKGSLANHFELLKQESDNFMRLGVNATVGGGTRMVDALKVYTEEDPANISQIHLALNGTLSFIMSQLGPRGEGSGVSLGQAVEQAIDLGYAEPGASDAYEVIKSEAEGDIPKKTAILVNRLGLGGDELLDWNNLKFELTTNDLKQVVRQARIRRFVVSLYSKKFHDVVNPKDEDVIGGFETEIGDFQIIGGFQHVDFGNAQSALGTITGAGNGAILGLGPNEKDGLYSTAFGPGAGVSPTVNTMLDDYSRISAQLEAARLIG